MEPSQPSSLKLDPSLAAFVPERRDASMVYVGVACGCGSRRFQLSGWPRAATGRGGFFWRTVARVWREAQMVDRDGEPIESPFLLPVFARCDACSREEALLDEAAVVGRMPPGGRRTPRESYRCRACRRGSVELVVGRAPDPDRDSRADFELVARCGRCGGQARVAWSEGGRPTAQEIRLDQLYGRR